MGEVPGEEGATNGFEALRRRAEVVAARSADRRADGGGEGRPPRRTGIWVVGLLLAVVLMGVLVGALIWADDGSDGSDATRPGPIAAYFAGQADRPAAVGVVGIGDVPVPHRAVPLRAASDLRQDVVDWVLVPDPTAADVDQSLLEQVEATGEVLARDPDGAVLYDVQAAPTTTTTTSAPTTTTTTTSVPPAATTPPDTGEPVPLPPEPADPTVDDAGQHTVAPGESFWTIATAAVDQLGASGGMAVDGYWRQLVAANEDRLVEPGNPDLVLPGQILVLPVPAPAGAP